MESYSQSLIIRRVRLVVVSMIVLSVILSAQLVRWQLLVRSQVTFPSEPRQTQTVGLPRGRIVDRNGALLAVDSFRWEIYAAPRRISDADADTVATLVSSLAPALGWTDSDLSTMLSVDTDTVLLDRNGSLEAANIVAQQDPRLLWADPVRQRTYTQGKLAAHLMGFVNVSGSGFYGVEGFYDPFLRLGIPPRELKQRRGGPLSPEFQLYLPSDAGHDLVLTIDRTVQYMIEQELRRGVAEYGAESGTIIVLDVETGEIVAMASVPAYDPNQRRQYEQPYFADPALAKVYEPGSVFKVITMAAALEAGSMTPVSTVYDTGELVIGGRTIRNSDGEAYGRVTMMEILARSLNVGAALVAQDLGKETFYAAVRRFGFGSLTQIDLDGEVSGWVRMPGESDWSESDLATNSYGQGLAVTPLQLVAAFAAIANDGQLMRPHIVRHLIINGQQVDVPPFPVRQVIRPETASSLDRILLEATEVAAGGPVLPGYHFAGKTGTAQIAGEGGYLSNQTITTYVGYGPINHPRLAVLVKLDKPTRSPWAQDVALPVFQRVMERLVMMMDIPPGG